MATTIIGILLIVMAVFLVISVLMQSSKDHRLGGSIAGGAETFFGKQKGKSMDALFNKLTTVIAIIFVLLVIVLYVIQPEPCAFCGSTDHEAATIEECPVIAAGLENGAPEVSGANLDNEPSASDADIEDVPEAETEPEAEVEAEPEAEPEAVVETEPVAGTEVTPAE